MAAGLGFKTFTTGEVLTAADTNGYLMQGVLVFASSAARAAAITSPQEGQYSYLKDTNSTEYYDGAAWIAAPIGDITGVTAGTGISGGGTSGTVTITNSMATEIAAKGDLIVGTGSATFDNLTVGANNTILTADSSTATGLKWAAAAGGGGKVLQVVEASTTTAVANSTSTAADTGLTATITPSATSSKVLIFVNQNGCFKGAGATNSLVLRLMKGGTQLTQQTTGNGLGPNAVFGSMSNTYLDSPATVSAVTYKTVFLSSNNTDEVDVQLVTAGFSSRSTIILMEIGA
jgi:hypothetical protein